MFFIFGWGRGTDKDLGPTLPITCPNCHNDTVWHFHQVEKWFTLFFLPVLPYESNYFFLCPVCSRGIQLEGDQLDHAKRLNAAAQSYLAGTMSEAEFRATLGAGVGTLSLPGVGDPASLPQGDVDSNPHSSSTATLEDDGRPPVAEPRRPMPLFWKVALALLVLLIVIRVVWLLVKEGI